jgi:hypothetical protein
MSEISRMAQPRSKLTQSEFSSLHDPQNFHKKRRGNGDLANESKKGGHVGLPSLRIRDPTGYWLGGLGVVWGVVAGLGCVAAGADGADGATG